VVGRGGPPRRLARRSEDFLTAKDAKEEKSRESWVKKNRIHSLLGALGVLAVQI
jgi:hypothetical protein